MASETLVGFAPEPGVGNTLAALRAEVGSEAVERLFATSHRRTALPGEVLVHIGQSRRVGLLVHGLLKAVACFPDGQNPTVQYLDDGAFYGLSTLFHPASMSFRVVRTSTVVELDGATVVRVARECPTFVWFVARELAATVLRLPSTVEDFGFRTVRERVAAHLLRLSNAGDAPGFPVAYVTHEGLADAVGSAREVVSRCLRSLRDERLVAIAPRAVYILDEARLARVAARLDGDCRS
jgi:CRP-like cAMP-binding protein